MTAHYEPDPLDAEWDKLPHTPDAYRAEIRQLRERCAAYAAAVEAERERLKADNERLRGLLTDASKAVWMNYDGELLNRIEAALKEVPR